MDRIHGSLEFQDPYEEISGLMQQSLITVEENCHSIQRHVNEQRKSIAESLRKHHDNPKKSGALQATLNFYDHFRADIMDLEEICHQYRMKIPADMAKEILHRRQPPFRTSFAGVKRAYELCDIEFHDDDDNERRSMSEKYVPNWRNVSPLSLEHTPNIIYGPHTPMPSEFDDTDQKFKQEIMILRTKMFSMSLRKSDDVRDKESITDVKRLSRGSATKKEFIETVKKSDSYVLPLLSVELAKVDTLKFVDGEFKVSDTWTRLLDIYGQQLRSKWFLVICPQIEALLKKYRITMIHLSPAKTCDFIMKIPENGLSCRISRKDLIPLVNRAAEVPLLLNSKIQLRAITGKDVAATLIQSFWRGFWAMFTAIWAIMHKITLQLVIGQILNIRKCLFDAECKYIAASIIWVAWIVVKKKRQMHERYLRNMLTSHDITRQLNVKLSNEYKSIVNSDHVVVHVPSVGFPLDLRRTFGSADFAIYQNTMGLKLSFIKNPKARVIYVLPVRATDDLLKMYEETIESVLPNENAQERVTFLELSQAQTFVDSSFNVSRTLHASEDTLVEIRKILVDKPAFCLPWIMDECDVRLAGNFGVPLLAPDVEMQQNLSNKSRMSVTIDKLGLAQPPYVDDVKDYKTLCVKLAEKICSNTEICIWLFKLNVGFTDLHTGVFLINHMSIPFMPILRKEREIHGDDWNENSKTRSNFLKTLYDHLPRIVSTLTRFSKCYNTWEDFYAHMTKYGCLLQAVPNEKSAKYVSVTLFVPGYATGELPQWTGTVEKIYAARESRFSTVGYTIPQTFVDNADFAPIIERLTDFLQKDGYFGHLCIDLYCFRRKQDDKVVTLVVETNPCYEQAQHFVDWIKFAINGSYNRIFNKFDAAVGLLSAVRLHRSSTSLPYGRVVSSLSEAAERYAIAIGHLHHSQLSSYSWKKLAIIGKECGIRWDSSTKEGAHLLLHDGTSKNSAMIIAITSSMESAIILMKNCLKKLYKKLRDEAGASIDNNFREVMYYVDETLEKYRTLSVDKCDPLNRVR